MKNIIFFKGIIIFFIIFAASGCQKGFLEKYPPDKLSPASFYQTKEDAIASINAAYDPLQQQGLYGRDAFRWGAKTEELYRAGDFYNAALYLPSNSETNRGFTSAYQGILFANTNLALIPPMKIDKSLKTRIIGEALFLRGFYYYFLVRWYGGVPIILEMPDSKTNFELPREPAEKVYEQAIKDFTTAIDSLPEKDALTGSDVGRASKGAAKAVLADLYLYLAAFNNMDVTNYGKVKDLCLSIINSGKYSLETKYVDIFDITKENGKESIFEVQFAKGYTSEGSEYNEMVTAFNSTTVVDAFYNFWNPTDLRRGVSVILPGEKISDYTNNSAFKHQKKQITGMLNAAGPGGGSGYDSPRNFAVQRYANILLMYAEAMNELSSTPPADAISYMNQIRNRAGLANLDATATATKVAFREAIRAERKYELAYEGFRWFDLVRYEKMGLGGGLTEIILNPTSPYYNNSVKLPQHFLFPMPQSELDANRNPGFKQNPGY